MKSNKSIIEEVKTDYLKDTTLTEKQRKLIDFNNIIKDVIKKP